MTDVVVAGASTTVYGRHPLGSAPKLVREAGVGALHDAGMTYADVQAVFTTSCHPASPRGVTVMKELGLSGAALQHVENASASGLSGMHAAVSAIRSGACDSALVLGFDCADHDLPVADVIAAEGNLPAPILFALWAKRRMAEHGTRPQHLAAVAAKNWNYARANPFAGRRSVQPVTVEQVLASRMVADPLRSMMCTSWGEGASAVVLVSGERGGTDDGRPRVRVAASRMRSESYEPGHVFLGAIVGPPGITTGTALDAYEQAGVGPEDIDVVQVHDAFAIEELVYYEALGFCGEGEAESWVAKGAFGPRSRARFGKPEVSTDGGLIARGHPGGPTGVAQVVETVRRLRTTEDRWGLCHLLGSGSVCAVEIFERVGG